jgi:hypothetical protein
MRSERLRAAWWLMLAWLACGHAWAEPVPEHDMKAAFVYNFALFTEWPPAALGPGAPLAVCVNAASPLYAALGQLKDKPIHGRPVALRAAAPSVRGCHVLVVERGDRERWPQWKRDLEGGAVLTVTDDRVIGGDGAAITLSQQDKRIAFDIDLAAVRAARLVLSSKLLRLARSVQ